MIITSTNEDGSLAVALCDMGDWHTFVRENADAIEDQYGSAEEAYRHLVDGGLTFGGGAAPLVIVYFDDIPD